MVGADSTPSGTTNLMFKHIKESLDRIETDHKADKVVIHDRINDVEECINKEIKPDLHQNKADIWWLKKGFWFVALLGSSALLIVVGILFGG